MKLFTLALLFVSYNAFACGGIPRVVAECTRPGTEQNGGEHLEIIQDPDGSYRYVAEIPRNGCIPGRQSEGPIDESNGIYSSDTVQLSQLCGGGFVFNDAANSLSLSFTAGECTGL
jgi:hypothetical protein